jgi:AraC-like DNA-binding protein
LRAEQLFEQRMVQLAAPRPGARYLHAPAASALPATPRHAAFPKSDIGPAHEFVFAVRGAAALRTPAEAFVLRPGRLLLIDPGVEHAESPAEPPRDYLLFWCEIHRSHCFMGHTAFSSSVGWKDGPSLEAHGHTHLQSLAAAVASELFSRHWGWERAVSGLLGYLSSLIIRRLRAGSGLGRLPLEPPSLRYDAHFSDVLAAVMQYCHAHLQGQLRLPAIAAAVGYSPSHISHLFTSRLGRTLSDYLRELRLTTARDLLLHSDLPIAGIAESVGYRDPAHFTRAFVKAYQTPPRAFRKRHRPL